MRKILIVDDSPDIIELVQIQLEDEFPDRLDFICAYSGNAASEILNKNVKVDLIICDVNMPDGDGYSVYNTNLSKKIPFIFHTSNNVFTQGSFKPSENVITKLALKPFESGSISDLVRVILDEPPISREYFPIRPIDALGFLDLIDELYIRIKDNHFVLISRKSDPNREIIEKYVSEQKFNSFFIKKPDVQILYNHFEKGHSYKLEDQVFIIKNYAKAFIDDIQDITIFSNNLNRVIKEIQGQSGLRDLLDQFQKSGDVITSHSLLTFFTGSSLLKKFGIYNSKESENLLIASMSHDLYLDALSEEVYSRESGSFQHVKKIINRLEHIHSTPKGVIDLVSVHHCQNREFNGLNLSQKIFVASHAIAEKFCIEKVYNKERVFSQIEAERPPIYGFLKS